MTLSGGAENDPMVSRRLAVCKIAKWCDGVDGRSFDRMSPRVKMWRKPPQQNSPTTTSGEDGGSSLAFALPGLGDFCRGIFGVLNK